MVCVLGFSRVVFAGDFLSSGGFCMCACVFSVYMFFLSVFVSWFSPTPTCLDILMCGRFGGDFWFCLFSLVWVLVFRVCEGICVIGLPPISVLMIITSASDFLIWGLPWRGCMFCVWTCLSLSYLCVIVCFVWVFGLIFVCVYVLHVLVVCWGYTVWCWLFVIYHVLGCISYGSIFLSISNVFVFVLRSFLS